MGKILTIIIVALLVIWGIYYVVRNGVGTTTTTQNTNVTYSTSTASGSETGEYASSSAATSTTSTSSATTTAKTFAVDIKNFAYTPATLSIKTGTKVTWTNQDTAPHTVTSVTGTELNSAKLAKGESYSHTFTKPGTYQYYCTVHPNMKATIVVTP